VNLLITLPSNSLKALSFLIFLLLLFPVTIICQDIKELTEIKNFGNNPGNLKMFVHSFPATDTLKKPLVVVLHGCAQNTEDVAVLTGWNKIADINSFTVLYPQQKMTNNPNRCFNWFMKHDIEKGKGECESIYQMISFAIENYNIDSNRIFVTGLSAGAAMSMVMISVHPALFNYAAVFAGGAYKIAMNPYDGTKVLLGKRNITQQKLKDYVRLQNPDYNKDYPGLIIYQGLNDPVVNHRNAYDIIRQWTGINNIDTIADKTETSYLGIEDITRIEYNDSTGDTKIIFYEINNLGHRLLVKPGEKENEGGRTGLFGADKGFHSTWQTAKEFEILKEE